MFTDLDTENHLRDLAGLPAVTEDSRDEVNFDTEPTSTKLNDLANKPADLKDEEV
jgi:hypothetical protein